MKKLWRLLLTALLLPIFPVMAIPGGGEDDGLEKDDPNIPDDDDPELDPELDPEDEPEVNPDKPEDDSELPAKTFTQEELDAIIEKRLARERKKNDDEKHQQDELKRQQDEDTQHLQNIYNQEYAEQIEMGYDENVAKARAQREVQREQRILKAERQAANNSVQAQQTQAQIQYAEQKADAVVADPLVARYIKDIDTFAKQHGIVDFGIAADLVIGQKTRSGEITNQIRTAAEQRTLANVGKRQSTKVMSGSLPGDTSKQDSLSREEIKAAKLLGITPKEYAANKSKKR